MNLETLCNGINLQPELKNEVLDFYKSETFCNIKDRINGLKNMKTEAAARYILKEQLGEDEKQVKLLTCMYARQNNMNGIRKNPFPTLFSLQPCDALQDLFRSAKK